MQDRKPSLTVITATYNSIEFLPQLVESLQNQTNKDFEWVVADGGSTDGTLDYLNSIHDLKITLISEPDFGIYDAINKAIKVSLADYYIVIGSDDWFESDALQNYQKLIDDGVDVVTSKVAYSGGLHIPIRKYFSFMDDAWSYVSCHSVGCLFRKSLHEKYGFYSKRFPIAADQYFINKIVSGGSKVIYGDFVAGEFGSTGVSSNDVLGHLTETFRVQYETENKKIIYFLFFLLRLIKNKILGRF